MTQQQIAEIKELLATRKRIVIITHRNPDGDAMGSSLGLYNYLLRKKHRVKVITPNDYPAFLSWLPGDDKVTEYSENPKEAESRIRKADIIFCVDFNALRRLDTLSKLIKKSRAVKILIDHHPHPEKFAHYLFHDKKASSSAQLVYDLIVLLGDKKLINKKIANCLYTGIMTDTINFRINTTTTHTHRVTADLIEAGAQNTLAYTKIFDNNTENRVLLLGYALGKMKVLKEFNTAFIALSSSELEKFKFRKGDTEGMVNYPLSVEGIRFSALFLELKDEIKISFRSNGSFDVNKFARKHFSGGGHLSAAGGESHTTLDETLTRFVSMLSEHKDELLR